MRALITSATLVAIAALAGCDSGTTTSPRADATLQRGQSESCTNISGTIAASFVSATEIEGTIAGSVEGLAFATIDQITPGGNGALHVLLRHRYVVQGGEVRTSDVGVLTPIDPPLYRFNNRLTVVGGTGVYASATGMIHGHGTLNLETGAIDLRYHGRVCGIGAP
jgi:hypothetical protein